MNDHSSICDSLAEAISLLAADCLTPNEEAEARRHLTNCPACRERFEQLVSICSGLREARPEASRSVAGDGVARALAEIGAASAAKDRVMPLARTDARRRRLVAWIVAMNLLAVAGYLLFSSVAPPPEAARVDSDRVISPRQGTQKAMAQSPVPSRLPTWLALQRAAAHSDEALDDLLARSSDAVRFSPVDTRSLLQETDL